MNFKILLTILLTFISISTSAMSPKEFSNTFHEKVSYLDYMVERIVDMSDRYDSMNSEQVQIFNFSVCSTYKNNIEIMNLLHRNPEYAQFISDKKVEELILSRDFLEKLKELVNQTETPCS
jgi:hypothetical protein